MKQLKATRDELAHAILELVKKPIQRKEIVRALKRKYAVRTVDYHLAVMVDGELLSVSTQGKIRGLYAATAKGRTARYELAELESKKRTAKESEEAEDARRTMYLYGLKIEPIEGPGKTIPKLTLWVPESVQDVPDLKRYMYYRLKKRGELDTLETIIMQALRDWCLAWPEPPATLQE
jgi:DNA-binding PadR family transcriptional regulator